MSATSASTLKSGLTVTLAVLCVLASALFSFHYGLRLGGDLADPLLMAAAALAFEGMKLVSPTLTWSLWRKGGVGFAAIGVIGLCCMVFSLAAALDAAGLAPPGVAGWTASVLIALAEIGSIFAAMGLAVAVLTSHSDATGFFSQGPVIIDTAEEDEVGSPTALAPQAAEQAAPSRRGAEPAAPPEVEQRRRRAKRAAWSPFRRRPKPRPYGEGTAPPLDEPHPHRAEAEPAPAAQTQHHGRALHRRVKGMMEKLEQEARQSSDESSSPRRAKKDSA